MKHISTTFITVIFISLLSLVGCKKEVFLFMSPEERIVGEWSFEKVEFRKELTFKRENITSEFRNQRLVFNDDFTLSKLHGNLETQSIGNWEIDCYYDDYDEDSQTTAFLSATYNDVNTGECTFIDWDNLNINKKTMRASERKDGGIYFYKLERE